jgi:MutS domain V
MGLKLLLILLPLFGLGSLVLARVRRNLGGVSLGAYLAGSLGFRRGAALSPLAKIRAAWGRAATRERDLESIGLYHRFLAAGRETVDDQTWQDLGLDEVFVWLDRTSSMLGSQVLYARMRTRGASPEVLAERTRQYGLFRQETGLREEIQLLLGRLDRRGAEFLAPLLLSQFPGAPRLAWLLWIAAFLPTACLVGMFFLHPLFLAMLFFIAVNLVISGTYGQKITPYFAGFNQIEALLGVAERIAATDPRHGLPEAAYLREIRPVIQRLRQRLGWLVVDRAALPDLAQGVFLYLNMFFLFDILAFLRSHAALRTEQATLAKIFETVGSLDAGIAVASGLESLPYSCVPELVAERRLRVAELYHPCVPGAVSNAFALEGRSAVIAGPNMAGKTCFLRTVGLNLVLGQTLHFCLAREAVLPRCVVRSAIRREDNQGEGKSYFFAEIGQILEFIRTAPEAPLHFFLIDEIFRGTNTGERIASSVAVLHHLARQHLVLVTTHDSELQELLADTFEMQHFSDRVGPEGYGFDYQIRPGPAQSHNAIKLLELSGYPAAVIQEAEELVKRLNATSRLRPA